MDAKEIVERIMTQHWDMAACDCWICEAGRTAELHPRSDYLHDADRARSLERVVMASHPRWESSIVERRAMSAEIEIAARCKCGALALVRVDEREVVHGARASDALLAAIARLACYHVEREATP